MTLDGVVVEGCPFGPEGEGLPEERVIRDGDQKADEEATKTGRDDVFKEGSSPRQEQVESKCGDEDGELRAEDNASDSEEEEAGPVFWC